MRAATTSRRPLRGSMGVASRGCQPSVRLSVQARGSAPGDAMPSEARATIWPRPVQRLASGGEVGQAVDGVHPRISRAREMSNALARGFRSYTSGFLTSGSAPYKRSRYGSVGSGLERLGGGDQEHGARRSLPLQGEAERARRVFGPDPGTKDGHRLAVSTWRRRPAPPGGGVGLGAPLRGDHSPRRLGKQDPRGPQAQHFHLPAPCEAPGDGLAQLLAEPIGLARAKRMILVDREIQGREPGIRVVEAGRGHAAAEHHLATPASRAAWSTFQVPRTFVSNTVSGGAVTDESIAARCTTASWPRIARRGRRDRGRRRGDRPVAPLRRHDRGR